MNHIYEILIRGNADGTIAGSHAIEFDASGRPGDPRPLTEKDLKSALSEFDGKAIAEIDALKLRQGERLSELKAQHKLELDGAALAINGEKEKNSLLGAKVIELTSKLEAAEKALAASLEDFKEAKRLPRALPIFSNNAAATDGGLVPTDFYRNPSGQVMQVY